MKNINETILNALIINEAKENTYRVELLGCDGKDGAPITVTISVEHKDVPHFEAYLEQQSDSIFGHACGVNNDWEQKK